ncbi:MULTISPECIES: preprotein translocase subunit YajC [Reinekea]|jgi:preprotein translocase subunit YajC|uniref:Sec translocon accessory complex subunit YajC n=1 Tax=Reinekea forsetii TaxID=1336806 RepID=A0A2K8KT30_9GAMM|nr:MULTISPECIES: preprotein translocase subunit YajC [Reinekea]ATX77890.1 preprotein translocase subunit YajC [Reinekea forsetii]MDB9894610.1 preprotein translocase subunit YajC [Reinekea forsetii]MDO7641762.1 preprotein translocase subunit YajC [Reinekea forsetii]MDO7644799.1 preprotein translocase subunit YajC [Reinekea forsetii]
MKKLVALVLALIPVAALAAGETPAQPAWQLPIMLGVFFVIFWFMVWRPQSKRAKEHKNLLSSIGKGDEVVTNAGIAGKVTKVTDDYIQVEVAPNVSLTFQKHAISATLPKGTLKAI